MEDVELSIGKDEASTNGLSTQPTYVREIGKDVAFLTKLVTALAVFVVILFGLVIWMAVNTHPSSSHDELSSSDPSSVLLSLSPTPPGGYSFGGYLFSGSGEWVTKEQMPIALSDLSSVELNGYTYLVGGLTAAGVVSNKTFKFNPVRETFDLSLPDAPRGRCRHTTVVSGNRIYVIGGKDNYASDSTTTAVDVLDLTTNTWSTPVNMPEDRSDCAAAAYEGKIYIFGGYKYDYSIYASVLQLDTTTNQFATAMGSLPTPRGDLAAVTMGSLIYVLGGWDQTFTAPNNVLHAYNPATGIFDAKAPMSVGRGDAAAMLTSSGNILVVGGERESNVANVNAVPLHDVEEYHIEHDEWVHLAPLDNARFRTTGTAGQHGVHIFGGHETGEAAVPSVDSLYTVEHEALWFHQLSN